MLPPPPVKRPLHARFFETVPLLVCTVPQFPVPTLVVKLRRVGFTPQHACTIVVVVVLDVAVVVVVVDCSVVDVVEVVAIVSVVTVVLLVVARVVLLLVGAVEVVSVVLVVEMVLVVVTPPGQVQSARQSTLAPPTEVGGHVGLPGGSHCSPGSMNELPHDDGRLVLDEDEDEDVVVTVTVVVVCVVPVVDVVTGAVVVVVEPPTQSGPVQASQQLDCVPTQALPSGGA